ncbi:MAG: GlxA family transcriptional regulator [Thermoanaerobaculia bacterium]
MRPKRIGFLGYDGVVALDIVGASEAFASTFVEVNGESRPAYEVVLLGVRNRVFVSESGIAFRPQYGLDGRHALDTLIVPGGRGLREPGTQRRVVEFLRARAPRLRRVATVCTGIYGLAPTGLLDGRRATTHWRYVARVAEQFPALRMVPDALFCKDGRYYASAGVTAGIDLALAMIEEDFGAEVALGVARELVVYLKRPGGQEQYSEPLQFQSRSADRIGEVAAWVRGHLREDLSVEALAGRACLCPRQFSRRFRQAFRLSPAAFVSRLRLGEAKRRLTRPGTTLAEIAASVGFRSEDAFRRAFERRYGIAPSIYRRRFGGESTNGDAPVTRPPRRGANRPSA